MLRSGGLTVRLRAGTEGADLEAFGTKAGVAWGVRLATDGVRALPRGTEPAAMEIVIDGLSPGGHTIATYHNAVSDEALAAFDVSAGESSSDRVEPSRRVRDDEDAAIAWLRFEARSGESSVIRIAATEPGTPVLLCGFELDRVDPRRRARKPWPRDGEAHADGDDGTVTLEWAPAASAVRHDVRLVFGRSAEAARAELDSGSPDVLAHVASTSEGRAEVAVLPNDSLRHWAWRVDSVDSGGVVTRGDVWTFRIRHLAFPGAEGYGRFAIGGRGGRVHRVTTLADSGPGSLREGIEAEGPRTIVFDVSGLITLESKLIFRNPFLTVAGQTAPGKGISIRNYSFGGLGAREVIIRFVRVRLGDLAGETMDAMGLASCDHAIVDHCSVSWSIDEAFSSRQAKNITLQRTIISEALNIAGHRKYEEGKGHGFAGSISGDIGSFHHNLLAHNAGRNWSLAGALDAANRHAGRLDIRNQVVFNFGHRTTDGGAKEVQFVNNYYKPGPASTVFHVLSPERDLVAAFGPQMYYVSGNVMEGRYGPDDRYAGVRGPRRGEETIDDFVVEEPFFESWVTTHTAEEAYENVLADVGCTIPDLDDHDRRIIRETRTGTVTYRGKKSGLPGLPDSQADVGGWPEYPVVRRAADWDTDGDGMPGEWERDRGLDPDDASDGVADPDGDGYTNLEDYLHWLVVRGGGTR